MSNAEHAFNADVAAKKRIARGAYAKKTHNGKGGCRLPSDNLTPAQKAKLNGPVVSVQIAPMSWKEFKTLPDSCRKYYLETLIQKYRARDPWLAEMFGASEHTVWRERTRIGVAGFPRGGKPALEKGQWDEFVGQPSEAPKAEPIVAEPEPVAEPAPVAVPTITWEDLFLAAKVLSERYGTKVQVIVG